MTRIARTDLPDGIFHVTARGVARRAIFRDEFDYACFTGQLLRIGEKFGWTIFAYCLMPNHYHVILETTQSNLSEGMHHLNGRYARDFNSRYEQRGHVFESRFASYVIDTDEHFERALAYVRANPVDAGLCETIAEWPWADGPADPD